MAPFCGPAVTDHRVALVIGATSLCPQGALPPRIQNHAVRGGESSGRNRGVAGAGDRVQIRIGGLPEPGALLEQPSQALAPLALEFIHVIRPHLVNHQDHDQLRPSGLSTASVRGARRLRLRCQNLLGCRRQAGHQYQSQRPRFDPFLAEVHLPDHLRQRRSLAQTLREAMGGSSRLGK